MGRGLSMHLFSWHSAQECSLIGPVGDETPTNYRQKGEKTVKKLEVTFDEKEHLATVTIDGNKVYDCLDPLYTHCKTEFILESRNHGFERTMQIKHDLLGW